MSGGYTCFAAYYDALTGNVDYPARAAYLLDCSAGIPPVRPVSFWTWPAAREAWLVSLPGGESTSSARTIRWKCSRWPGKRPWSRGSRCSFCARACRSWTFTARWTAPYGTLDSLNHITDPREVKKALSRVSLFLEPGGIFLFDVNTPYKHEKVLGDHSFVYDLGDLYCVWQCGYDPATGR